MPYPGIPDELIPKMEACVEKIMAQGHDKSSAIAICHTTLMTALPEAFAGARHSGSDAKDIQTMHDITVKQGAQCDMKNIHLRNIYGAEGVSWLGAEIFAATKPGEPYRLFQFGKIVKGGKTRDITREYAAKFRLPHFKPPVKLGSHDETTPAGGHILELQLRDDGLYAVPEYVESGSKAIAEGAYRYHSPEVIWEDGYIEDPTTGEKITGPLIVGDALLHTPHLGEAAALYSFATREDVDMADMVQVPQSVWDMFMARLFPKPPDPVSDKPTPQPAEPEQFTALKAEAEKYKAEIESMKAAATRQARVEKFSAEIAKTKAPQDGLAELFAALPDAQSDKLLQVIKALSAQIDESKLTGPVGKSGSSDNANPVDEFNAAITAKAAELHIGYNEAFEVVKAKMPELFAAYNAAMFSRKDR